MPRKKAYESSTRKPLKPKFWRGKAADPIHVKLDRLIRSKAGDWSQSEIAEAAGMHRQVLSRILTGNVTKVQHRTLCQILQAIGATLSEFDRS